MAGRFLEVVVEGIPTLLKQSALWCVWHCTMMKDGQPTSGKFPISPNSARLARVNELRDWSDFGTAVRMMQIDSRCAGIGLLLTPTLGITGIDLDDAVDETGTVKPWAQEVVDSIPGYWELSPSGTGLHCYVRATLPPNTPARFSCGDGSIEVYADKRYLCVTGHRLATSATDVVDAQPAVDNLLVRLRGKVTQPWQPEGVADAPRADITLITQGCPWMAHCKLDAAVLSESEWYRALGVLGRCIGAEDLAHEWSKPYPRYTPDETAKKLRQAIANSRPVTCNYVATSLGQARFCDECPNRGRVRSPIVLGLPSLEPTSAGEEWPEPENLERELVEVAPFEIDLLPACCQAFAEDLAEEMQVPIDFPAVTILVTLAGVTGRRAKIRPKQYADWEEVGNLWGGLVSEPGTRKTPLIKRILKLVQRLEDEAAAEFDEEMAEYEAELAAHKARATRQLADGETPEPPPETPTCVRYLVNDATVPKFQQILAENPAGVLFFRDEIAAWFSVLDSKGRESDRHFYLEGWDGSIPLTFDRIIRGTVRAATNCISVFGGIQPGVLSRYLLGAIMGGEGDDGFAQRLQVGVYPDRTPEWRYVDCEPNRVAEEAVAAVYRRIVSIPPSAPFTAQFDEDAQVFFIEWLTEHERRIRYEAMPSYLRSHLSKYSGLMVRIALLCHLADDGESRRIPLYQAVRAAKWCQYLESHARRIYAEGSPRSNAAFVGDKIRAGVLRTRFTLRDFRKKNWSGMDSPKVILGILQELEDAGWIRREPVQPTDRGGRPTEIFRVNPKVYPG